MTVVATPKERNEHFHCCIVFILFWGAVLLETNTLPKWHVFGHFCERLGSSFPDLGKKKAIDEANSTSFFVRGFLLAFLHHSVVLTCGPCRSIVKSPFPSNHGISRMYCQLPLTVLSKRWWKQELKISILIWHFVGSPPHCCVAVFFTYFIHGVCVWTQYIQAVWGKRILGERTIKS